MSRAEFFVVVKIFFDRERADFCTPLFAFVSLSSFWKSFFFLQLPFFLSLLFLPFSLFLSLEKKQTNSPRFQNSEPRRKKKKVKIKNTINRASHRIVLIGFSTRGDSIAFVCSREIVFNVYACGLTLESEGRTSLFVLSLSLFFFERRKKKRERAKEEERRQEREKSGGSFSSTLSFLLPPWFEKKKKKKTQNEKNERRINGDVWIHSGWNKEQPRS